MTGPDSRSGAGGSNPFQGLEKLFERLSRQFEDAARSWERGWDRDETRNKWRGSGERGWFDPRIGTATHGLDLAEEDDAFVVTIDVPGYESDDLGVQLSGTVLSVSGERDRQIDDEGENYIRRERRSESFDRRVDLPDAVDAENVDARVDDGVLTIRLPKEEPDEARRIEIE